MQSDALKEGYVTESQEHQLVSLSGKIIIPFYQKNLNHIRFQ